MIGGGLTLGVNRGLTRFLIFDSSFAIWSAFGRARSDSGRGLGDGKAGQQGCPNSCNRTIFAAPPSYERHGYRQAPLLIVEPVFVCLCLRGQTETEVDKVHDKVLGG